MGAGAAASMHGSRSGAPVLLQWVQRYPPRSSVHRRRAVGSLTRLRYAQGGFLFFASSRSLSVAGAVLVRVPSSGPRHVFREHGEIFHRPRAQIFQVTEARADEDPLGFQISSRPSYVTRATSERVPYDGRHLFTPAV